MLFDEFSDVSEFGAKAKFDAGTYVKDMKNDRTGTIKKVWVKHEMSKGMTGVNFYVWFEYTIEPNQKSLNTFRCREMDIKEIVTDLEGNEMILD